MDKDVQLARIAHRQATLPHQTFPMTEADVDQWRRQFQVPDAAELDGGEVPGPPGAGDEETRTFITQTYQRAEAFLFGRRTYELFAGSWRSTGQMRAHPIGVALSEAPKYVASTRLTAPRWADTTVLRGDLAGAISELKAKPGGELQVHGSGVLARWLLENDLVDEMILIVIPVVLGQHARLFPETGPDLALDLAGSRVDSKGVSVQVYRPAGRPRYAPTT